MQVSLIVIHTYQGTKELNRLLEKGYKVVNMCPMPSSTSNVSNSNPPTCLVIVDDGIGE